MPEKKFDLVEHKTDKDKDSKWRTTKNIFTKNKEILINEVNKYLKENNISTNEFCKNLDFPKRDFNKFMDNTEDISLMIMAEIAEFIKCDLELTFTKKI